MQPGRVNPAGNERYHATAGVRAGAVLALLLMAGPCASASVSGADAQQSTRTPAYGYEVWPVEEGWVPSTVTAILQSRDGYIWLGTFSGLLRFDGVRFTVFDSIHTPGLQDNRITALFEDDAGTLWIGHETGELTSLAGGRFHPVNPLPVWPGGKIEALMTDARDDLWLINDAGVLFRTRDGRRVELSGRGGAVNKVALARDKSGRLWVMSNGDLGFLEEAKREPPPFPEPNPGDYYERVAGALDGGLWVVGNGRIRKWSHGKWVKDLGPCPWGEAPVTALCETREGSLAVGTLQEGLYLVTEGAQPMHFSRTNGLSHDWVRSVCEDSEGDIWVATGGGLDTLRPRKVIMLDPPDHWQGRAVLSFALGQDGSAWIGTEGAGLYHYQREEWKRYDESAGLSNLFVWSVLETRRGDLFVGTWGAGLFVRNGDHFESAPELAQITAPVVSLFEGRDGEVWAGTTSGLYRYQGGKLSRVAAKEQLYLPDVRAITQTTDGALWLGMSGGGLGRFKDDSIRQFRKKDGLSSDFVQALYADDDGTVWAGTSDNGLTRARQGKFATISLEQGLAGNVITHIVDDNRGSLWMGSHNGVFRAAKADLNRCADGLAGSVHCFSYGKAEGLASLICSGGFQPGACRVADGSLWFPTAKGMAILNPANVTTNPVPPPVLIEELAVDGKPGELPGRATEARAGVSPSLRIAPGRQRFQFQYTALSFPAPDKVLFKYRLEGLERDWVEAGTKRVAEYSYLPPRSYRFQVIACNNDEVWNNTGASLSFSVLPHFWQTVLFQVFALASGAALVGATVLWATRRRVRRKLEALERQRALERERARIARDIHDDLGASLTRISMLSQTVRIELDGNEQAAGEVDQIYSTAREMTRAMDEIVWAVNPKHDSLDSLVTYLGRYAQRFLSAANIRCRLDVPLQLPALALTAEVRHNAFLAFKEALNNVVRHARASEVRVSLELMAESFALLVADNGCGFDAKGLSVLIETSAQGEGLTAGNGLLNMRKRMEEIDGAFELQSAPQEGTRVKFVIPTHK